MTVQSRQSVQDLLLQHLQGTGATAPPKSDIPFQDLLDGALQNSPQPPKAESPKAEQTTKPAGEEEQPAQAAPPREPAGETQGEQPVQAPQEQETDDTLKAALVAAAIAPAAVPLQQVQPQEAPSPETAPRQETAPLIPVLPQETPAQELPQTAPQAPVEQAPQTQPTQPTAQAQPQQAEILSAQLTVESPRQPEQAPPAEQTTVQELPQLPKDKGQQRFDNLVAKASQELKAAKPEAQAVKQQAAPPEEEAQTAQPKPRVQEPFTPAKQAAKPAREAENPEAILAEEPQAKPIAEKPALQPQAPQPAGAATPAQQIEAQVLKNLEDQKMEFRMQLAPKELGKVDVRMVLEGGKLTVEIAAASQKAVQELQKTSEGLISSLRMAGAELQSVQIVHEPQQTSQHMDGAFHMESGQSGRQGEGRQDGSGSGRSTAGGELEDDLSAAGEPIRLLDETA